MFLQRVTWDTGYAFARVQNISGKPFSSSFLPKDQIPLIHSRIAKYNFGQEIRIGNPESSEDSKRKLPKFSSCERITNSEHDRVAGGVLQR